MKHIWLATIILPTFFFSGCATMDKSECLSADWRTIGLEDGAKGKKATYIANHRKACAEYGVTPDLNMYQAGRKAGLRQYCTEPMGFSQGKQGNKYYGVCPPELRDAFLDGYEKGRTLYALRSKISQLNTQVKSNRKKLKILKGDIYSIEARLISNRTTPTQRQTLLQDLKELQIKQGKMESKIKRMEIESAKKQGKYDLLRSQYGY